MANPEASGSQLLTRKPTPLDGLLSYLIPGLGQISQGRTGKGLLFFFCVYGMFFYGMFLGRGTVKAGELEYHVSGNVYLPDTLRGNIDPRLANPYKLPNFVVDLYNRPQFAGQFWVGVAAWPAIIQYATNDEDAVLREIRELQAEAESVGNSQPQEAGRLRAEAEQLRVELRTGQGRGNWLFGQFERAPTEEALNALNTTRGKELDLGWVYTVIAGVLNIMIIYDAMAGPAYLGTKGN
jgi:uncharacterized protein DUF6677